MRTVVLFLCELGSLGVLNRLPSFFTQQSSSLTHPLSTFVLGHGPFKEASQNRSPGHSVSRLWVVSSERVLWSCFRSRGTEHPAQVKGRCKRSGRISCHLMCAHVFMVRFLSFLRFPSSRLSLLLSFGGTSCCSGTAGTPAAGEGPYLMWGCGGPGYLGNGPLQKFRRLRTAPGRQPVSLQWDTDLLSECYSRAVGSREGLQLRGPWGADRGSDPGDVASRSLPQGLARDRRSSCSVQFLNLSICPI